MTGMYVASNTTALSAQFGLTRNMGSLSDTLMRLSTGLKINSGKDDPAGLIASELLKAQITGTSKAITNAQRANSLVAVADSSLGQIGNLLNDIKGLTVEAAQTGTMTQEQLIANQLQVDAALNSIDRIARTTNYGGKKLLDGSMDFRTAGMGGGISNLQINAANFGTASAIDVNVSVQKAADYARLIANGTGVSVDTTLDIVGNRGSSTINLGAGATNAEIAAAINKYTDSTGVIAYVEGQAQRGSIVLSSAGGNNDIVVTALDSGLDAGNYEFRITQGYENDARVVQEAKDGKPGIIEISLKAGSEARYTNFADMFDISIDTTNGNDKTAINMTRGTSNLVTYAENDKAAATNVINGKSIVASVTSDNATTSALNGWTVAVDNSIVKGGSGHEVADLNTKTVYISTTSTKENIQDILGNALSKTVPVDGVVDPTVEIEAIGIGSGYANGDRFTFAGGATAGEVNITYAEGATAGDILKLLNNAPNVQASLKNGVSADALIKNIPDGKTSMSGNASVESRYTSSATAQEVIDLINSKLGDKFIATGLASEGGTGGRVSYMDAAVDYGDINLGNALRFTGMDNGPIVRMTNLGTNGQPVANQKLSVSIIHPSEADIKAGIHTPILEIKLATDGQGNSITTAKDIADFFSTLTPEQTMGVSVAQLYPPGVDPNGRIFGVDECGKPIVIDTCATPVNGIVQPTGAPGVCGPNQGDLILLGGNQRIVEDNAVARVNGNNRPEAASSTVWTEAQTPVDPTERTFNVDDGTNTLTFHDADAAEMLRGMTILLQDSGGVGHTSFDASTGTLTLDVNPGAGDIDGDLIAAALGTFFDGEQGDPANPQQFNNWLAINEWLVEQGREEMAGDWVFNGAAGQVTTTADSTGGLADGDAIELTALNEVPPPETPSVQLEFSREDGKKLEGINFEFVSAAGPADPTFNATTKTVTITLEAADYADEEAFLAAVNDALEWLATTDATDTALTPVQIQTLKDFQTATGFNPDSDAPVALNMKGFNAALTYALTNTDPVSTAMTKDALAGSGTTAKSAAVPGANPKPLGEPTPAEDATAGTVEFEINGATFSFSLAHIGDFSNVEIIFDEGGTAGAEYDSTGGASGGPAITIDVTGWGALGPGAMNEDDLVAFLNGLVATMTVAAASDPITDIVDADGNALSLTSLANAFAVIKSAEGPWDAQPATDADLVTALQAGIGDTLPAGTAAVPAGEAPEVERYDGTTFLTFDETSAMNGMTFGFTRDETKEGFDYASGTLMVFLDSHFTGAGGAKELDDLRTVVNDAINANWEAIRAFTGATGDAVQLAKDQDPLAFTVNNALTDAAVADRPGAAAADGKTMISGSFLEGKITGERGIGYDDSVLNITANAKGTQMAGVNIHFVNDTQGGLKEWKGFDNGDGTFTNGAGEYDTSQLPDIKVEFKEYEDGSKELIITANLGAGTASELNAGLLAAALNANSTFQKYFSADARQFSDEDGEIGHGVAGTVLFNTDISKPSAQTVGGYRVESEVTGGGKQATSSGIGMTGQTDANERLVIESEDLGSNQYVEVKVINGQLNVTDEWGYASSYAEGADMIATINGIRATAQGNNIGIDTSDLSLSMNVGNYPGMTGFTITGGGALFQLGPDVVSQQQVRIGIGSMLTTNLGGASGQLYMLKKGGIADLLSSDASRKLADKIVNEAIASVASTRGRLGAMQRGTLEPTVASLQDSLVALTEANAMITNADFAVESSNLTRLQLLIQAGAQTLGIANQLPQYAASLIR